MKPLSQKLYFTVGPSQLFPTVKKHIEQALMEDIPSLSHRSAKFSQLYEDVEQNLKKLLSIPKNHQIFFLASATEAFERIVENCAEKYSFHFIDGAFSKKFDDAAIDAGREPIAVEPKTENDFNFSQIKIPKKTELFCFTHNETSNGAMIPLEQIYSLKDKYPQAIFALDIVSSAPYADVNYNKIDCVFFSVQKGFGLPAGLALLIVSPQAMGKAEYLNKRGTLKHSYHDFIQLMKNKEKFQTYETPNVLDIYLLAKVVEDMLIMGIENIRQATERKAKLLYQFIDQSEKYNSVMKDDKLRSKTTIVVEVKDGSKKLQEDLKTKNIIVGSGYGSMKDKQIRIANFPAHSEKDIKLLISNL